MQQQSAQLVQQQSAQLVQKQSLVNAAGKGNFGEVQSLLDSGAPINDSEVMMINVTKELINESRNLVCYRKISTLICLYIIPFNF